MNTEELLKKHVKDNLRVEDQKLLDAEEDLIAANSAKELLNASMLLAKTTKTSAELLARTTKEAAELLARTTKESTNRLQEVEIVSAKLITRLTILGVFIGFLQVIIAIIALYISQNLK